MLFAVSTSVQKRPPLQPRPGGATHAMQDKRTRRSSAEAGLSLVEILVVLVIMSTMMAVAFATCQHSREDAIKKQAVSVMYAYQDAIEMYRVDNDGIVPTMSERIDPDKKFGNSYAPYYGWSNCYWTHGQKTPDNPVESSRPNCKAGLMEYERGLGPINMDTGEYYLDGKRLDNMRAGTARNHIYLRPSPDITGLEPTKQRFLIAYFSHGVDATTYTLFLLDAKHETKYGVVCYIGTRLDPSDPLWDSKYWGEGADGTTIKRWGGTSSNSPFVKTWKKAPKC